MNRNINTDINTELARSSDHPKRSTKVLMLSAALSTAIIATGCQSTSGGQGTVAINQTPAAAKTALAAALQKQRRQSFAYHSNLEISNEQKFLNIDESQLVASEYVDAHCEETHDKAYAALIEQAQTAGKMIESADYAPQRSAIKQSYLACDEAYRAWDESQYNSAAFEDSDVYEEYDDAEYSSAYKALDDTTYVEDVGATVTESRVIKGGAIASDSNDKVSPYYQELFDNYDNKTTKQNVRNAQLLDAYLLKPLSINAQGVYQPVAGKITMLSSMQYKGRNHHSSINQPIYFDAKEGAIYFWADNIAMLNSELFDNKLGTQWQNKWLKLTLNDGTLPKDFGRTVIKSHFDALDRTFETAPLSQFDYVTPQSLSAVSPKYPAAQLAPMLKTPQIIRRAQSTASYEQFYQDYMSIVYETITTQYPDLVTDSELGSDVFDPSGKSLTSKAIVQQILSIIKSEITGDESAIASQNSNTAILELYGLDNRGRIKWQHMRNQDMGLQDSTRGITIDVLQQYAPITSQTIAYPSLPADVQEPNASNSVDIRDYSRELIESYREGNGTALGKMLFRMLPMSQERLESID
ncbi:MULTISPECIES: hypothetical protein [unclassified Psychrobacter]|uniref:hypothetical protein n=1 Tax=unclassified Psychrobacter TaxID=196806 RepID=UPI003FD32DCA